MRMGPPTREPTKGVRAGEKLLIRARDAFIEAGAGRKSFRDVVDAALALLICRSKGEYLTKEEAKNLVRANVADNLSALLKFFLEQGLPGSPEIHVTVEVAGDDRLTAVVEVDGKAQRLPGPGAKCPKTDHLIN